MQMSRHQRAAFNMIVNHQNVNIYGSVTDNPDFLQPGFFRSFFQRYAQKVLVAVSMPADPGPCVIQIVVNHQNLVPLPVHNPGGSRKMADQIVAVTSPVAISRQKLPERTDSSLFDIIIRPSDIRGGDNAGIVTCWYNPEGIKAPEGYRIDHEIRDLHEVYGLL